MNLSAIIKQTANQAQKCGITVKAQSHFSMVAIDWPDSEGCFLQDSEADDFCDEARRLWEELGDVTETDCALYLATHYVENLS